MRKVLAVASVGVQHRELVFKDLKSIFKRIKISLDVLLQQEIPQPQGSTLDSSTAFKSYPYITLTIPNYEQHREYLEKVYKNNVLFSKFILLISKGDNYEELVENRNQQILREHCRNWNNVVNCSFESTPVFTEIEERVHKINKVLGQMDIRGKISEIDAKKKFHLIEDHRKYLDVDPHPSKDHKLPSKLSLLKLFFGLEVGCGKRVGCGAATTANIANYYSYSSGEEFIEMQEEKMMDVEDSDQDSGILSGQQIIERRNAGWRRSNPQLQGKMRGVKRQAKRRFEQNLAPSLKKNPYLKKKQFDEVVLSQGSNNLSEINQGQ